MAGCGGRAVSLRQSEQSASVSGLLSATIAMLGHLNFILFDLTLFAEVRHFIKLIFGI
jgi:hypothetical protein